MVEIQTSAQWGSHKAEMSQTHFTKADLYSSTEFMSSQFRQRKKEKKKVQRTPKCQKCSFPKDIVSCHCGVNKAQTDE